MTAAGIEDMMDITKQTVTGNMISNTVAVLSNNVGVLTSKRTFVRELLGQNHLLDVPKTLSYPHTSFRTEKNITQVSPTQASVWG